MKGITRRIVTKSYTSLVLMGAIGIVLSCQATMAVPATLNVGVQSPPLPATESDIITLLAITSDEPLGSSSDQSITLSLEVNGYDIDWILISNPTGLPGAAVMTPAIGLEDIGPLPAGTYNVTATWSQYNHFYIGLPPQYLLDLWLSQPPLNGPRIGTTQFTVIPEPASLAMLSTAAIGLFGLRRRV